MKSLVLREHLAHVLGLESKRVELVGLLLGVLEPCRLKHPANVYLEVFHYRERMQSALMPPNRIKKQKDQGPGDPGARRDQELRTKNQGPTRARSQLQARGPNAPAARVPPRRRCARCCCGGPGRCR